MTKLFPPYLNQGSKGPAVNMLALLLKGSNYEQPDKLIVLDGKYTHDGAIVAAVKAFQTSKGMEPTGDVDPQTRAAIREEIKDGWIDIDDLTVEMFEGKTVVAEVPTKEEPVKKPYDDEIARRKKIEKEWGKQKKNNPFVT